MAAKVLYKQGTKKTYLGLEEHLSNALYFCTDTKELFKGDDLYSDGLRLVGSYAELPSFDKAADGILYYCEDTGCGFVLSTDRDAWVTVIHGVDGETIEIGADGLMSVKSVPIAKVSGLTSELERIEAIALGAVTEVPVATHESAGVVKPSAEFDVGVDGTLSLKPIEISKVTGLEDRLASVESAVVGGVRYCGAVETVDDLPTDAKQGDLYEVRSDASEWCFNGEKWFEYGKTVDIDLTPYAEKREVRSIAKLVDYEVSHKPEGTLVNYSDGEVRVMCPADTEWALQQSGSGADPNLYYIGFKAYAPSDDVVSFKEDLAETVGDDTMYYFEGNDFAGIDEYGRKYSIVWLPVAKYDEASGSWTYYGSMSSVDKYIGWYYSVEWYNAKGVKTAIDTIRINLADENCYNTSSPYYVNTIQQSIDALEKASTWGEM